MSSHDSHAAADHGPGSTRGSVRRPSGLGKRDEQALPATGPVESGASHDDDAPAAARPAGDGDGGRSWAADDGPGRRDGDADEDLFRRFRTRADESAFERLVHRYETELFGYLKRYLGSAEMAEDVFQATFLQVYLKKEGFDEGRRFRPWLYTIATNQAIDAQRRNRRHRMVSLDQRTGDDDVGALVEMLAGRDETADERLSGEEAKQWVRAAVEDLPDTLRGALLLVYHQGLKYREAADVLGVPVGTVKSRLHAALLKLNRSWQDSGNTP